LGEHPNRPEILNIMRAARSAMAQGDASAGNLLQIHVHNELVKGFWRVG
jgi:hypothetical protein